MKTPFLWLLPALLLSGCGGTPTTYLSLSPVRGPTHEATGSPVSVAHVAMPASIDRLYLTSATGATTLHVAAHARWAASLGGEAQSALARDLAQRLPDTGVLMPGDPISPGNKRMVMVNVTEFLPRPGIVVLDADWRVIGSHQNGAGHHTVLAKGRAHIRVPAGKTPAARARAMSAALGQLADTIAIHLVE